MIKFKFYHDAGHEWVRVSLSLLVSLNAEVDRISEYSYIDGHGDVYLEGDCDAEVLVDALNKTHTQYEFEFVDHGTNSPIRRLSSFSMERI